jgi:hypothetical protein
MAFTFKHASIPAEATREYDLGISTTPDAPTVVLTVRHAGEGNRPYWSAMFRRINAQRARGSSGTKLSPDQLEKGRAETAEIFASTVIVGWRNAIEDGKAAEFSPEAVLRLLTALIAPPPDGRPDVFDELRRWCETASNFGIETVDAVELGKK